MGKRNFVADVVKRLGGRVAVAALVKPAASPNTVAKAEDEGAVRLAGLCIRMAEAYSKETNADFRTVLHKLAGLE